MGGYGAINDGVGTDCFGTDIGDSGANDGAKDSFGNEAVKSDVYINSTSANTIFDESNMYFLVGFPQTPYLLRIVHISHEKTSRCPGIEFLFTNA